MREQGMGLAIGMRFGGMQHIVVGAPCLDIIAEDYTLGLMSIISEYQNRGKYNIYPFMQW